MNSIKNFENSFSNLLTEIQGMVGVSSRYDASEFNTILDLVIRLFWEAFNQLHENYYWLGSDVIKEFELQPGETVGGGYLFDGCNKRKPAFDINLTLHKNFYVMKLVEDSSGRCLQYAFSLQKAWFPYYMLLTQDTCRELKILPNIKSATKYLIHFKDAGVVACERTGANIPVGLDGLKREFLKYATAFKLAVRLNITLPQNFNFQYQEIKNRLLASHKTNSRSIKEDIWINHEYL